MAKTYSLKCNCCKLNDECQMTRVTTRAGKQIPGCGQPYVKPTLCEESNIDIKVKDYPEYLHKQTCLYLDGQLSYDMWNRSTWNYGNIRPVR